MWVSISRCERHSTRKKESTCLITYWVEVGSVHFMGYVSYTFFCVYTK